MPKICDVCGRGARVANSRSKSNIASKRRQLINLQSKKIDGLRQLICTSCLKSRRTA